MKHYGDITKINGAEAPVVDIITGGSPCQDLSVAGKRAGLAGDSDSARYKALGNSIALPFWQWMARRICAQYERPVTMASLFDGIGGFPLVFQRCGAVPVWASEIEEFPIAVTKVRFQDESM